MKKAITKVRESPITQYGEAIPVLISWLNNAYQSLTDEEKVAALVKVSINGDDFYTDTAELVIEYTRLESDHEERLREGKQAEKALQDMTADADTLKALKAKYPNITGEI